MPGVKEYNGVLFDQLAIVERIKRQAVSGDMDAVNMEIEIIEKEIKRKLYQSPALLGDKQSVS